jgi:hypothetical protein
LVVHPRGDHAKPKPPPAVTEDAANTAPLAVQRS